MRGAGRAKLGSMPLRYGLIDPVDLEFDRLPVPLQGLRLAHLADPHLVRWSSRDDAMLNQLAAVRVDLVLITGDLMLRTRSGTEPAGRLWVQRLMERVRPRYGVYGIFGNHDSSKLIESLVDEPADDDPLASVTWLQNRAVDHPDLPLRLLGLSMALGRMDDSGALALSQGRLDQDQGHEGRAARFTLALAHTPTRLGVTADLGADMMLAGHTHGGQVRLPGGRAIVNHGDLPKPMSAGILRHRRTLAGVSRGLGTSGLPLRLFCPPHVPLYTLRRGRGFGAGGDGYDLIERW